MVEELVVANHGWAFRPIDHNCDSTAQLAIRGYFLDRMGCFRLDITAPGTYLLRRNGQGRQVLTHLESGIVDELI